jgi:hypothetical protein
VDYGRLVKAELCILLCTVDRKPLSQSSDGLDTFPGSSEVSFPSYDNLMLEIKSIRYNIK